MIDMFSGVSWMFPSLQLPSHRFQYSVWHDLREACLTGTQLKAPRVREGTKCTPSVLVVHTTVTLISWNPARFPPNLFSTGMILTGMFSSDIRTKHDTFYDILTINCYWFSKIRNYLLGKIYCLECVFIVIMPMQNRFGAKCASAKHASGRRTPLPFHVHCRATRERQGIL